MSAPAREPLAVQYVRALLPYLSPSILALPSGARAVRESIRAAGHARGWHFTPTRSEIHHALTALAADGTLASHRREVRR